MGDVVIGLGVDDLEIHLFTREICQKVERNIFRLLGIIQPTVGIFFDDDRAIGVFTGCACHETISF